MKVQSIFRYPFKGLSAEPLAETGLIAGQGMPGDRQYALALEDTVFDADQPDHLPKTKFLMLMRDEALAGLRSALGDGVLTVASPQGDLLLEADVARDRLEIETFFHRFAPAAHPGRPRLVTAPGHMFSDTRTKCLSVINLASIRALESAAGWRIDPLRFRANVYFDGGAAWCERDWAGKPIRIGAARLTGLKEIDRCAATMVDPVTAARDLNIPQALQRQFGHIFMGMYATVDEDAAIRLGDEIEVS